MNTHNIQFHDKIRTFPYIFVFLSHRKNFVGTKNRVRTIHGKRAIGVRAIEVLLYTVEPQWLEHFWDHGNSSETWVVRATEGNHGTSSGSK